MENPQDDGLVEEDCSSSESGWTKYLSSPVHHEDDDDSHDIDVVDSGEEAELDGFVYNNGFDSDDSMASDASSGPAYRENTDHGGYMEGQMQTRAHPIKKIGKKLGEDDLYDDYVDKHVEEGGDQDSSSISPSIQESLQ